ncbi:MAG: GlsB/YeaQ/YmgE family stress response membrane protein [Actinomycetota bacterium]
MKDERMGMALAALPLIAARGDAAFSIRDVELQSIVGYILIGLVVGILARFLVPGRDPIGVIGTILIGVVGAVVGGWLAGNLFEETRGVDWIASIAVAVVLVLLIRSATGRRRIV